MLRPKRMSRVSVTGSKRVMDEVIEAVHDLNLFHLTDYDDTWEGFDPGDPVEGADEAAEKLVTVRALESTLGVTEEDAGRTRIIDETELETQLEETRTHVNDLDDRRAALRDERRQLEDRIEGARPFAELGMELDLLTGYDSITVAVGEGDADEIRAALEAADEVDEYELWESGRYVAIATYPQVAPEDVLVGTPFTRYEVPALEDAEQATDPETYIEELQRSRQRVESKLDTVENELVDLRHEVGGFLLAVEEKLSIEVQKREAPLTFATTANAFVAEGWIPTERYPELEEYLRTTVGDHVEVEELERASYEEGHPQEPAEMGPTAAPKEKAAVADGGAPTEEDTTDDPEEGRRDGSYAMSGGTPPVVQDNASASKPFELLVGVINRPRYTELDPTFVLFLTFPAFFGFMIGDVGYGILYCLMGWYLLANYDTPGMQSLGGVAVWAGVFTAIFGVLYGEFFGLHELGYVVFGDGGAPMDKGLSPATIAFAWAWLIVSLLIGIVHLSVGYVFGFLDDLHHGVVEATAENLSWLLVMVGAWVWVFSEHLQGMKPDLLFTTFNAPGQELGGRTIEQGEVAYNLYFGGLPEVVGLAGLAVAAIGLVLLIYGEGALGLIEVLDVFVNVLSYTRIAAVLLAKGGMAFVVNLLVLGGFQSPDGGVHFIYNNDRYNLVDGDVVGPTGEVAGDLMFGGLLNDVSGAMFLLALLVAAVVFVVGHITVLLLGITAAGLQGIRLEYVEFFNKFYEGGGKPFQPFGYERRYTTED